MGAIRYRVGQWLRTSWPAVVGLAIVVALVGALSLTLVAGATRTLSAPDRYADAQGFSYDASIQQPQGAPQRDGIAALPAVARVEMASFVFGGISKADGTSVDSFVFAGSPFAFGAHLVDGRLPDPADPSQFVASAPLARSAGFHLGERFDLQTLTQAQADQFGFDAPEPDGPHLAATLVGTIDGASDLQDNSSVAVFPASLLTRGDVGVSATVGVVQLAHGASLDDLRAQVGTLPEGSTFTIDRANWVAPIVRAAVSAQGQGLLVLAAVVSIAAVVVLGQLMSRQLRLADDEAAALWAIGDARSQITGEPLSRTAIVATLGAVVASVLAFLLSDRFPVGFVTRVEPSPGRRFDVLVHGLGPVVLVVALVVWMWCSLTLARHRERYEPSPTLVERSIPSVPDARAVIALRFAFGRGAGNGRAARASLVGLGLVFVVMAGALTFGASLTRLIDQPSRWGENFDVGIGAGEDQVDPAVVDQLAASPDVAGLTLYGTSSVVIGSTTLDVIGMDVRKGDVVPQVRSGRLPVGVDEVALGAVAAGDIHANVGDVITAMGASGSRQLRVTGIVIPPPVNGADTLGRAGLVTSDGLHALDPEAGLSAAAVRLPPGDHAAAVRRLTQQIGKPLGQFDPPGAILNLDRVRTIPYLVAASVGVLALLSLGHLLVTGVRRRRRELAVIRALGATHRWVSGIVHWQATIVTTVVLVVALPLGAAAGSALYRRFVDPLGVEPARPRWRR